MYAVSIVLITIWLVTASSDFIYFKMNTFYIKAHQLNLLHVVILVLLYLIVQIFLTYSRDICNWHWGQVSEALQTFCIPWYLHVICGFMCFTSWNVVVLDMVNCIGCYMCASLTTCSLEYQTIDKVIITKQTYRCPPTHCNTSKRKYFVALLWFKLIHILSLNVGYATAKQVCCYRTLICWLQF